MANIDKVVDKAFVHIDEHNLDKECVRHTSDTLAALYEQAETRRYEDELKRLLIVETAELALAVRSHPGKYGLEKPTEKAIEAVITTDNKILALQAKIAKASHKAELAVGLVRAMEHRKRMLTLLVNLHGAGYYSDPSRDKNITTKGKEAIDNIRQKRVRTRS